MNKELLYYRCGICKGSKKPKFKSLSTWLYKHFDKQHKGDKIVLDRIYK